jgi:hypothetical protein
MRTVIILGAGASIGACYPPTSALLPAIEDYAQVTHQAGVAAEWKKWVSYRDSHGKSPLVLLLHDPNPEIVLSALDLLYQIDEEYLPRLMKEVEGKDSIEAEEAFRKITEQKGTTAEATQARQSLLRCLSDYFTSRFFDDVNNPQRAEYIRDLLGRLKVGDVVITFNWDCLAELALGKLGLWNPTTGYGLERPAQFLHRGEGSAPEASGVWPSPVHVLKLHGSVGWRGNGRSQIAFEWRRCLQLLQVALPGRASEGLFTGQQPQPPQDWEPLFVPPTYLKGVPGGEDMQQIWHLASRSIWEAECVEVYGYSLPPSDTAARVLLNPLRARLHQGDVVVKVTDPSPETRRRWDDFLGFRAAQYGRLGQCHHKPGGAASGIAAPVVS